MDSRLRGNDENEAGNDENEAGNDENEAGNDENEAGNDGSQRVPTPERVLRHPRLGEGLRRFC
ncbi:hypothetical protein [Endozoicomonas sp. ALB122]|uniref:hypothetical protein n=1 Tax=Endozoicomonas sp. ALB122 TaxID=3403075 RepID=UPI003BB4D7CA